jgi:hypothetical protein
MESSYLIWLFAPFVLWKRKDFGSIRKKSLLKAKTLRLETEGVNVCDLEFDSSLRFFASGGSSVSIVNDANVVKSRKATCGRGLQPSILSSMTRALTVEQTDKT